MRYLIALSFMLFASISFSNHHVTDKSIETVPLITELPTPYTDFVDAIGMLTPKEIIKLIGEPAKKIDLKMKSSNEIIASTWFYHNLNTDHDGNYFPTTELDIIDGYVESVVFMNNIDENSNIEGQKYDIEKSGDIF
jgi:hypothetical protein